MLSIIAKCIVLCMFFYCDQILYIGYKFFFSFVVVDKLQHHILQLSTKRWKQWTARPTGGQRNWWQWASQISFQIWTVRANLIIELPSTFKRHNDFGRTIDERSAEFGAHGCLRRLISLCSLTNTIPGWVLTDYRRITRFRVKHKGASQRGLSIFA